MAGSHDTRRFKRVSVGLLASLVLSAPFALVPAGAQNAGCGTTRGAWNSLAGPSFSEGPRAISDFMVSPSQPVVMYATNGTAVQRTTNGGCLWQDEYHPSPAEGLPLGGAAEVRIVDMDMPGTRAASGRAYLALGQSSGPLVRPRVQTTIDGGQTWVEASAGLPPVGTPVLLRAAPSSGDTVYVAIEVQGVIESLYGSDDGGTSWTMRSSFARSLQAGINDLRVDPLDPNELWAASDDGLYRSFDGGRSFSPVEDFVGQATTLVDVFHSGTGPANVMAFLAAGGALISEDGGENWLRVTTPGTPTSAAHGAQAVFRMISSLSRTWIYAPNIFSWVDARAPEPNVQGLVGGQGAGPPTFYGFTASSVEIYRGPVGASVEIPPNTEVIPDVSLLDPGIPPPPQRAELSPDRRVVKIDAGDNATVPYRLQVPRSQTPLDVYLLVDTSSSQRKFLAGVVTALEDILNGLTKSGVDVQFGMAEYRNYPHGDPPRLGPPGSPCTGAQVSCYETNYIYRQIRDLAPGIDGLAAGLENVEAGGGGHYNAQPAALLHTASPHGEDVEPTGPSHTDVPSNTNASFRRNALRVALIVSDEEFIYRPLAGDATPPDLPSFDEVSAALNAKDIKQVGISLRYRGVAKATPDMADMAGATDAIAPPGGVDCDGDAAVDLAEGSPLVCEVNKQTVENGGSLAPAIVNLVESIRTRASLELEVHARDGLVQKVTPELYESVALQASRKLTYDVTFRCPLTLAGKRLPVKLTAQGVVPEVSASATVVCGSVADREEDDLPFPAESLLGLIPLVPISPPPPVTELVSSTQAQAQSQAQAQAQASMAAQEQEQPQLAFVHAVHALRQNAQEEYAMSSFREPAPHSPAPALAGATVLMSFGFGLALVRQRRSLRLARARPRPRRAAR
jgi:hypothetical protein